MDFNHQLVISTFSSLLYFWWCFFLYGRLGMPREMQIKIDTCCTFKTKHTALHTALQCSQSVPVDSLHVWPLITVDPSSILHCTAVCLWRPYSNVMQEVYHQGSRIQSELCCLLHLWRGYSNLAQCQCAVCSVKFVSIVIQFSVCCVIVQCRVMKCVSVWNIQLSTLCSMQCVVQCLLCCVVSDAE